MPDLKHVWAVFGLEPGSPKEERNRLVLLVLVFLALAGLGIWLLVGALGSGNTDSPFDSEQGRIFEEIETDAVSYAAEFHDAPEAEIAIRELDKARDCAASENRMNHPEVLFDRRDYYGVQLIEYRECVVTYDYPDAVSGGTSWNKLSYEVSCVAPGAGDAGCDVRHVGGPYSTVEDGIVVGP